MTITIEQLGDRMNRVQLRFQKMTPKKLRDYLRKEFAAMTDAPTGRFDVGYKIDLALDELEDRYCKKCKRSEYRKFEKELFNKA